LLVFLCGVIVSLLVWWPMLASYPKTPELDGRLFFFQLEIGRAPLFRYHELSLWNPFDCRGVPFWDYPENVTGSPLFFLTLPFKAIVQYYAFIIVHCALGFTGTWLLARDDVKLDRPAAFVAAAAFALSASLTFQVAGGHIPFVGFWDFPLLLFLWRAGERDIRAAVGLGILYSWMIYHGATYPTPFCTAGLIAEGLLRIRSPRRFLAIARAGVLTAVTAITLSAARLLPLIDQFRSHVRPNPYPDVDAVSLKTVWAMFTLRTLDWSSHINGQEYVWNEYTAYVGLAGVALVALGAVLALSRAPWLVALALALFVLMLGHFAEYAPWSVLNHHVFPYTSMRVPSRFRLMLALPMALFIGIAVEEGTKLVRRLTGSGKIADGARTFLLGLALISVGDAVGFGISKIQMHFNGAPLSAIPSSPNFHYGGAGLASDFIDLPRQNRGWLGCRGYEWVFHSNAPVWQGDVPQAKAADAGAVVEHTSRTQNTFTLDVDVTNEQGARVLLNSGYEVGWHSSVGTVVEDNDLLAVDLPRGKHQVRLDYRPAKLTLGLVMSGVAATGIVAFFILHARWRRRRRATVRRSA